MEKIITFRGMESSEALKEHIEKKLQRIEKFKDKSPEAHVILSVEGHRHVAEIHFTAKEFQATIKTETSDMYASVDEAITKLQKNISKHHAIKTQKRTRPKV